MHSCYHKFEIILHRAVKQSFCSDQIVPGELTVVTGVPNSGKSEWIDALLCNLNRSVGWKFVLCSMENKVSLLIILKLTCNVFLIIGNE